MRKAPCINALQSQMQEAPTNHERRLAYLLYQPPLQKSRRNHIMEPISKITLTDEKAYDDIFKVSAIVESAITLLDILGVQSLSENDWCSAAYGISTILKAANNVLNEDLDGTVEEKAV